MAGEPEIRIAGETATVRHGSKKLAELGLEQLVDQIATASEQAGSFEIRPEGARVWARRGDAVAAAFELPPHARTVRWLADDSKAPFGPKARYREYYVGFPYVVLLFVFRGGALTGLQQLYYRTEPLDAGEDLLIPNLYNVANGYGQQCWLCLQHVDDLSDASWPEKIARIVDHTFSAAFNRSAEKHEGNSYWTPDQAVDARVASMKAWEQATREDRRFALSVPWKSAGTTVSAELREMLDHVVRARRIQTSAQLVSLISGGRRTRTRKGGE